ncbi:MAG: hypothetical protein WB775_01100, partial [Burkholderiaceae bacterium]
HRQFHCAQAAGRCGHEGALVAGALLHTSAPRAENNQQRADGSVDLLERKRTDPVQATPGILF